MENMKIYSKIEQGKLLHIVYNHDEFMGERIDIIHPDQFIQCAAIKMDAGKTFKPHKHIDRYRYGIMYRPQESWVVISGKVKVTFYDIDDTILHEVILNPGDVSVTLQGAHNYIFLEPSKVYEFKTGPYLGQENDKVFI